MNKNYANNFYFEAEASFAEAYFAYSQSWSGRAGD